MFGHRYFGARYFGPRYWGDGGLLDGSQTFLTRDGKPRYFRRLPHDERDAQDIKALLQFLEGAT